MEANCVIIALEYANEKAQVMKLKMTVHLYRSMDVMNVPYVLTM